MKVAVINDEMSQDLDAVVGAAADAGLDGIEVRSFAGLAPPQQSRSDLEAAARRIRAGGLAVAGYCPPAAKLALPADDTALDIARTGLVEAVTKAKWLGAPHVRVFSFYRDGAPDPQTAARRFLEASDGVDRGVPLLLETGTRTNTPTVALATQFLDLVGDRVAGLVWDPGNSVFAEFVAPGEVENEWACGRDVIRHIHVKDPIAGQRYVRLGEGDVAWPALLKTLAADGYDRWLSLETHWRTDRVLTPQLRDEPHGDAFSAGGWDASLDCIRTLLGWLTSVR
jgi:sugar phosphate isomerase/epimerase